MAYVNSMNRLPIPGDVVKKVDSDGMDCIDIYFESGKIVSAHFDIPKKEEENKDEPKG